MKVHQAAEHVRANYFQLVVVHAQLDEIGSAVKRGIVDVTDLIVGDVEEQQTFEVVQQTGGDVRDACVPDVHDDDVAASSKVAGIERNQSTAIKEEITDVWELLQDVVGEEV